MNTKITFLLLLVVAFSTNLFSQKKFELSDVSKFTGISDFVQVGEKFKKSLPTNKKIESELKNLKAV